MPLYRNKGKTYPGAQRALIGKSGAPRSKRRYTLLITSQCRRATARIGGTIPSMLVFAPHSVRAPLGLRRNHYKARLSDCAVGYDCKRYAHDKGHKDYRLALKHTVKHLQVERRTRNHVWVTGVHGTLVRIVIRSHATYSGSCNCQTSRSNIESPTSQTSVAGTRTTRFRPLTPE
jgi:hypothetical protein